MPMPVTTPREGMVHFDSEDADERHVPSLRSRYADVSSNKVREAGRTSTLSFSPMQTRMVLRFWLRKVKMRPQGLDTHGSLRPQTSLEKVRQWLAKAH